MHFSATCVTALAALSLLQLCPAPFASLADLIPEAVISADTAGEATTAAEEAGTAGTVGATGGTGVGAGTGEAAGAGGGAGIAGAAQGAEASTAASEAGTAGTAGAVGGIGAATEDTAGASAADAVGAVGTVDAASAPPVAGDAASSAAESFVTAEGSGASVAGSAGRLAALGLTPSNLAPGVASRIVGGSVAGGIGAGASSSKPPKRAFIPRGSSKRPNVSSAEPHGAVKLPPGITPHILQMCKDEINAQREPVLVSYRSESTARFDNVPPTCMNLVSFLLEIPDKAGCSVPLVLGISSLEYQDITAKDKNELKQVLSLAG